MALVLLDPISDPSSFDVITIAGRDSPGLAQVGDPTRSYQWDVKVGKGAYGSTTTFTGRVPAEFSVTFTLWRKAHFAAWELFCNSLKYDPAKIKYDPATLWVSGVTAVDIYHPSLAQLDINKVVVKKITGLVHKGKGVWTTRVDFLEWYPPPKLSVVSTPVGSTPIGGLPTDVKGDRLQSEAASLFSQTKSLGLL